VRPGSCAQRRRRARTHAKHRKHVAKHKRARHAVTVQAPASPAQQPASCEDASKPVLGDEGYVCADGSEPTCADGAEPIPTGSGSTPMCPTTAAPTVEWSEAGCEDGSTPAPVSGGFACEDGSQPACEDASQPVDPEGSLSCIAYGAPGSSTSPSAPGGGADEGSAKPQAASAS
jgi:hypothetical protein